MSLLAAYGEVFDALLGEAGGRVDPAACREIRRLLFEGFDPAWLSENQKFDLSLSSPGRAGLRLSVSDYGEKPAFPGKLAAVFALLGEAYDSDTLSRILAVARPTQAHHQTTFGLEWKASEPAPRLKVYFEELRHRYSLAARARLLKLLCAAADAAVPRRGAETDIAALCVDFLPGRKVMLKSYAYSDWKGLARGAPAAFTAFAGVLSLEKRAFFYKTRRYDRAAKVRSRKLYKVYEVRQIEDFTPALSELSSAIARFGAPRDAALVERCRALAAARGCLWYPVLCALDLDSQGAIRVDSYFSLR